jgi:hypothetical protein
MERAAALTGPAGRPMIASGYEKAGRGWTNSLLPNGMRSISAHPAIGYVPEVRLRASNNASDWIFGPAFAVGRPMFFVRALAARL